MGCGPSKVSQQRAPTNARQRENKPIAHAKPARSHAYEDVDMTNTRLNWNEKVQRAQKVMGKQGEWRV